LPLEEPDDDPPLPPLLDALPPEEPDDDDPPLPLPLDALPLEEPDDDPGGELEPLPEPQPARVASPTNANRTAEDSTLIVEAYRAARHATTAPVYGEVCMPLSVNVPAIDVPRSPIRRRSTAPRWRSILGAVEQAKAIERERP
jgi:hypothetical protein